jgi:hypothetical protein
MPRTQNSYRIQKSASRTDCLVLERWTVEESLTTLKAAARQLLRSRAGLDRIRAIATQLRHALRVKDQLERQLAEVHCTVQFVYPL